MADTKEINVYQTVTSVSFQVEPNTNVININKVTNQGGGGTGATNLGYTPSPTNGIVTSDTGGDATIPLADATNAGLLTPSEKTKLQGIAEGAEVNVNADWNATSGDAQILNKPTIPSAVTQTSQLTNNGADGVNPFITALDIPVGSQASTLVREVKNMTGATLTKGTVVYISGANGNKPLVSKALATTDSLSSRTFGMLQSDILNNGLGYCVIIGDLSGVDTSSFSEGAQLYLSGTTAGTYTSTKNLAPTHLVYVGKVTRVHATQGQVEVGIQNGYELEEIHDCQIVTPTNNDGLFYETSTDLWKNKSIATALGFTPYNATNPSGYQTASQVQAIADAKVSDTNYLSEDWGDFTTVAPSKNATKQIVIDLQSQINNINTIELPSKQPLATVLTNTTASFTTADETKLDGIASGANVGVVPNASITGATKTKITYDAKGLVTAGADANLDDLGDVTITTPTTDQVIKYNGTAWVNGTASGGATPQTGQVIVTSGTSFTTPANITTSTVWYIELIGAGGGGGATAATTGANASGGGGGGYCFKRLTGLTPSTTYPCQIGSGGAGGTAPSGNGGSGGITLINDLPIGDISAEGGAGGLAGNSQSGGTGGTSTSGDINLRGESGGDSSSATSSLITNGKGGNAPKGWGQGGKEVTNNTAGQAGQSYGGGGSGGHGNSVNGGAGANGIIYAQYFN